MNQQQVETFVETLDNVQREENYGYHFYFVGNDHRLPFVTLPIPIRILITCPT